MSPSNFSYPRFYRSRFFLFLIVKLLLLVVYLSVSVTLNAKDKLHPTELSFPAIQKNTSRTELATKHHDTIQTKTAPFRHYKTVQGQPKNSACTFINSLDTFIIQIRDWKELRSKFRSQENGCFVETRPILATNPSTVQTALPIADPKQNADGEIRTFQPQKVFFRQGSKGLYLALDNSLVGQDTSIVIKDVNFTLESRSNIGYGLQLRAGYRWPKARIHLGHAFTSFQNYTQSITYGAVNYLHDFKDKYTLFAGGGLYYKTLRIHEAGEYIYKIVNQKSDAKSGLMLEGGFFYWLNPSFSVEVKFQHFQGNQNLEYFGENQNTTFGVKNNLVLTTKDYNSIGLGLIWHDFE